MAEKGDGDDLNPEDTGFKPPPPKSLQEICSADQDDASLMEYKKKLLGDIPPPVFPDNPKNVIVQKLQIEFPDENRPPAEIKLLDSDLATLKKSPIVIKEGVTYRVSVFFFVQREIVAGLRYIQATYKLGVRVSKDDLMVGSYPPKSEPHVYRSPPHEAPSGMIARGAYAVKSRFTDDDRNDFLSWEWAIKIKDSWKE